MTFGPGDECEEALVAGTGPVWPEGLGAVSGPGWGFGFEEPFAWLLSVAESGDAFWPPKPGSPVSWCGVGVWVPPVAGGETGWPLGDGLVAGLAGESAVEGVESRGPAGVGVDGGGVGVPVLTESGVDGGGAAWWSAPFVP